MADQPTARARIERAMHVSFKLPEQVAELLDAYRDQVLTEAAELLLFDAGLREAEGLVDAPREWREAAAWLLAARTTPTT